MDHIEPQRSTLSPSAIAQFYKLQQCPMYLYHRYVNEDFAGISDIELSPLLAATGEKFEESQLQKLLGFDVYSIGPRDSDFSFDEEWTGDKEADLERTRDLVIELSDGQRAQPVILYQPHIVGEVGQWPISGEADIVIVTPEASRSNYSVELRIIEVKSSISVQTHHQLQAAIYSKLFESLLGDINPDITASIVSQDPNYRNLSDVITRSGDLDLRRLSTFDLQTRQNDVQLLLEDGGTVDDILLDDGQMRREGEPPTYRIDTRCDGCSKQTKCLAHSVINKKLSLLGLAEGVQQSLDDLGVSNLYELATLYDWPTSSYGFSATSYEAPDPADPELVTRILRETEISNLSTIAQIAHRFLREIDPQYDAEWDEKAVAGPWGDYLLGSGRNLPEDNPPPGFDLSYPRKSLVRIYPYVQHDTVRNRIVLLAAKVTCSRYEEDHEDGMFVTAHPHELPNADADAKDREELRLIEAFYEKLTGAIEEVRPTLTGDGYDSSDGFLHLYPYGDSQRRALVEAVKRHPNSKPAQAFRTLLGYREEIDQETVSVLRNEFRQRQALRYPGLGVVQTAAQFFGSESDLNWERHRDPHKTPLKQTFGTDFFRTTVPYREFPDRIQLQFDGGLQIAGDKMGGVYPVTERHREVLPLEYFYAAEEFDLLRPELADDDAVRERIIEYRHHTNQASPRVTLDDIDDAVRAICEAYERIERCISEKDATSNKEPLNLANLQENSLGVSELQTTCLEYQDLEYGATRRELERRYREPLGQRVAAGKSLPFEVETPPIESTDENDGRDWVGGSLLRSLGTGSGGGIQADTQLALEGGSYVVMTPLRRAPNGNWVEDVPDPVDIKKQILGKLTHVDTVSGEIRISLNWKYPQPRKKFRPHHKGWTTDPDDLQGRRLIEAGMHFTLDAALDDFVAHHSYNTLQHAEANDVHNRLVNLYDDEIADALRVDQPLFDPDAIDDFVEKFDDSMEYSVNRDQESFVQRVHHTVAALQGPPGTGKTRYASAPALLARAYTAESDDFCAVASAHSNTAVDEIAEAVGHAQQALQANGVGNNIKCIRVRSDPRTGTLPANIPEFNYYDDREELNSILKDHLIDPGTETPLIIFSTPVTLRNLVDGARSLLDTDADSVEEVIADGDARIFDLTLVDEASMMDLPLLFLVGAFLGRDKQLLLVGDHRQMQPIQKHDWETEDRKTIEENTPSVSVLDFIRFLRGDQDSTFEQLERDSPTWSDKQSVLPMDPLQITYRLPPAMAKFETELFYYKDGINLESQAAADYLPDVRGTELPDWVNAALNPDPRVTLLLHDDNVFTKDSPVEAYLAKRILDPLPVVASNPGNSEVTGGLVVPFRLMRRRLRQEFDLTVDTVERFQGGERDIMVLAMTAGNQGYVNQLEEFLLDANRFNVGASRMKRKLFIIASKSLFRAVSSDPRKYEQQKAWKQLYQSLVVGRSPVGSTTITPGDVSDLERDITVEIYNGYTD